MSISRISVKLDREGLENMMPDYHGDVLSQTIGRYCAVYAKWIKLVYPSADVDVTARENRLHSGVEIDGYGFDLPVREDFDPGEQEFVNVALKVEEIGAEMLEISALWDVT